MDRGPKSFESSSRLNPVAYLSLPKATATSVTKETITSNANRIIVLYSL